jgi:hypothetical protein
MTDPSRDQDPTGIPRWVKVSGIVAAVVVAVVLLVMALIGGEHGPGRHMTSGAGEHSSVGASTWVSPTGIRV